MRDILKGMNAEGSLRFSKPSQIQKNVFHKFGYLDSEENIGEVLIERCYIKKSKLSLWLKY